MTCRFVLCVLGTFLVLSSVSLGADLSAFRTTHNEYQTRLEVWKEQIEMYAEQTDKILLAAKNKDGENRIKEALIGLSELEMGLLKMKDDLESEEDELRQHFREGFRTHVENEKTLLEVAEAQRAVVPMWSDLVGHVNVQIGRIHDGIAALQRQQETDEARAINEAKCTMCKRVAGVLHEFANAETKQNDNEAAEEEVTKAAGRITPGQVCERVAPTADEDGKGFNTKECIELAETLLNGGLGSSTILDSPTEEMKKWRQEMAQIITKEQVAQLYCQDIDYCDIDEEMSEGVLNAIQEAVENGDISGIEVKGQSCASKSWSFCLTSGQCVENEENPCPQGTHCSCYTGPKTTVVKFYAAFATVKGLAGAMYYAAGGPAMMCVGAFIFFMTPTGDFEISTIMGTLINYFIYGKPSCKCMNMECVRDSTYGCRLHGPHEGWMNLIHSHPAPKNQYWSIPEPGHKCAKGALGLCWLTPCAESETHVGVVLDADARPQGVYNCQSEWADKLGPDHFNRIRMRTHMMKEEEIRAAAPPVLEMEPPAPPPRKGKIAKIIPDSFGGRATDIDTITRREAVQEREPEHDKSGDGGSTTSGDVDIDAPGKNGWWW